MFRRTAFPTLVPTVKPIYRKRISPNRPNCCRFIPTCSAYALEAVEKYGVCKAQAAPFRAVGPGIDRHSGKDCGFSFGVQAAKQMLFLHGNGMLHLFQDHIEYDPVP